MNYVSELTTCGNMVYHVKLSRFDHAWFCQIHCQAKFYFLLLDKFFSSLLCLLVTVILKVLNWGVYRGHEIFVMMTPGFLSNLNSCIPCKAWLHGWWITIDHSQARTSCLTIRLRVAYETNKTNCRCPLRYINSPNYTWKTLV